MRKAALIAASIVLAAAVLAFVLPRVISLDPYLPRIAALMEEKTGRKVAFLNASLSLFPGIGITLDRLTVSGDPGHPEENFLTVPEAEIRVAVLPLLTGRVEFAKIILSRPEVVFRKYRDGTHSLTQISERLSEKEGGEKSAPRKPMAIALKTVSVDEAKLLLFLEDKDGRETRWEIDPLTLRLDGIGGRRIGFLVRTRIAGALQGEIQADGSLAREDGASAGTVSYRLAAQGKVFGQPMSVEGRFPSPPGVAGTEATIAFPKIEMEKLPGMFARPPDALAKASPEGLAALSVKLSGTSQTLAFEATGDLTRAGWTVAPGLRKFIDAPCTVSVRGERLSDRIVVSDAEAKFPPLSVTGNASLYTATGRMEWAASASVASLAEFAKSRGGGFSKYSPSGKLTASGKGVRSAATGESSWHVALDLGNVGARIPDANVDVADLDGHVEFTPGAVEFHPLAGLFNGQRFSLNGSVSLGAATAGQVSLYMPYLDLDAMVPPEDGGGKRKKEMPPASAAKPSEERKISAKGSVRIDAGKIRGLEFKELAGTGRYEGDTLTIDTMRAKMYGGEATVTGRIRFRPPHPDFRVQVAAKNIQAEEVLSRTTRVKDYLSGAASLSADLGGSSRDFAEFSRTAAGSGSFRVAGGKIKGVDLLAAATGLSGLRSLFPPKEVSGGKDALETTFSDLGADFRIEGGKIRSDDLRIASGKFRLEGKAALGFDRAFDFRGSLLLPPEVSRAARGLQGKFLADASGRVEIPLVMSGPVTSPAIAIDAETLAKGLAGRALRNLLEKPQENPAPSDSGASEKQERPAPEKALKGLFEKLLQGK